MFTTQKDKYIGKENYNHQGYLMKIIEYRCFDDIDIEFAEPYKCVLHTRTNDFIHGNIVNPYAPTVCGIGIVGNKYSTVLKNSGGKHCKEYDTWSNMLKRCYSEKQRYNNPTYIDVTCDPIWYYFENFYEWIHDQNNYEIIKNIDYCIDKDILFINNRIYAPDKCTLVPRRVNNLLLKSNALRGDYPIGVHYNKRNRKYVAQCGGKKNSTYLGIYETVEDAFNAYKSYKENMIKEVAKEEYNNGTITEKCYQALLNYEVKITD